MDLIVIFQKKRVQENNGEGYLSPMGLPTWLSVNNPPANAGTSEDTGSIPGSGRSSGGGNGHWLQDSCLVNSGDRGAWWATVHRVAKSWTPLRDWAHKLTSQTFFPPGLYLSSSEVVPGTTFLYILPEIFCACKSWWEQPFFLNTHMRVRRGHIG